MTDTTHTEAGAALAAIAERPTDEKGRVLIAHLSDRELAEEAVAQLRSVADAIAELSETPMMQAMRGGGNPLMAMFGRG